MSNLSTETSVRVCPHCSISLGLYPQLSEENERCPPCQNFLNQITSLSADDLERKFQSRFWNDSHLSIFVAEYQRRGMRSHA